MGLHDWSTDPGRLADAIASGRFAAQVRQAVTGLSSTWTAPHMMHVAAAELLASYSGVLTVESQGAVGDGTTDDTIPFQNALAKLRANGGGTLLLRPGKTYVLSHSAQDMYWNANDGTLTVLAYGATVRKSGSGTLFYVYLPAANPNAGVVTFFGGRWDGDSATNGQEVFRVQDVGNTVFIDVRAGGLVANGSGTKAWHLRNYAEYTENTVLVNCRAGGEHNIYFTSAAESGGGGQASFARTRVYNFRLGGGYSGSALIRCAGAVYDSVFSGLYGNIAAGSNVFHLKDVMGGTWIENIGVENTSGSGGYIYDWGTFTGLGPHVQGVFLRSGRTLHNGTPTIASDAAQDDFDVLGDLDVTGNIAADGSLSTEAFLSLGPGTTLTIAGGVITATGTRHQVDTEGAAASDDVDTINGFAGGRLLVLNALESARTVVLKDGTGNLRLAGDCTLDHETDTIVLVYRSGSAAWTELCRSDNAP